MVGGVVVCGGGVVGLDRDGIVVGSGYRASRLLHWRCTDEGDGTLGESTRDKPSVMFGAMAIGVYVLVALGAQGNPFGLAVGGGGSIVALVAEGQGGDGSGEVDTLMGLLQVLGVVVGAVALVAGDVAVVDTENGGARGRAHIAYGTHTDKSCHRRLRCKPPSTALDPALSAWSQVVTTAVGSACGILWSRPVADRV